MTTARHDSRHLTRKALAGLDAARTALVELSTTLQERAEAPFKATDWRAQHRPGTPSKLESDPEPRAFVLARIDRLTFEDIASEVAAAFPPERRTSRSALHRWWHRWGREAAAAIAKSWLSAENPGNRRQSSDRVICNPLTL